LQVTMLFPCVAPKFWPVIVTFAASAAGCGEIPSIWGCAVKLIPSLAAPPTVTTRGPDVAEAGTEVAMDVAVQDVIVAVVPLNLTVLLPWLEPKPVPVIITAAPVFPEVGLTEVMLSPEFTVKLRLLLAVPPAVTTTFPVVAPLGTGTVINPSLQLVAVPVVPLNLTVLAP
jgi:hypothetical protein